MMVLDIDGDNAVGFARVPNKDGGSKLAALSRNPRL